MNLCIPHLTLANIYVSFTDGEDCIGWHADDTQGKRSQLDVYQVLKHTLRDSDIAFCTFLQVNQLYSVW